ncbi:hypothetical protein CFP65_4544 [Kitasatospora sp. MMS16-BH015]|uniref:hypothetical protein n=1 Tax=Kitasatospora sp. MMS16-BH015 TaxID=2018025 RepID=UPI000CA3DB91|nr:hypothetical protein [Kitasatospora sp. MMS16-BH015]AUG79289.1 hypothetical protein CFP65_4544 [Kitasatospora sp. MMS16-BH015]
MSTHRRPPRRPVRHPHPPTAPQPVRPAPSPFTTKVSNKHVQLAYDLIRTSGALERIRELEASRPGPDGVRADAVLVGLFLAARSRRSTNVDDAWELMTFGLSKKWRQFFGLAKVDKLDLKACHASAQRFYRGCNRVTTVLDPARHNRRIRLPRADARPHRAVWAKASDTHDPAPALSEIANRLVLSPVRIATDRGLLDNWRGHLAVDGTAVAAWARKSSSRHCSLEISAGNHVSGDGTETFGYTATLLVAGHADPDDAGSYPQLCMGMAVHTPSKQIGTHAVRLLEVVGRLTSLRGFLAGDRAYTNARAETFHQPVRVLGWEPLLDYRTDMIRPVPWRGAIALAGDLLCPHTPERIINAYHLMADRKSGPRRLELLPLIEEADPYTLPLKQSADAHGNERRQCPAAGPSPKVQCPWAAERDQRSRAQRRTKAQRPVVDLSDRRTRRAHPAAKPVVRVPDTPAHKRPEICQQPTIGVPVDLTPKLRQKLPWGRALWQRAYGGLRNHIEGLNGRVKNVDTFLDDPTLRQSRGRVAQTLLAAIQLMVENLSTIEGFLRRFSLYREDNCTLANISNTPDPHVEPGSAGPEVTDRRRTPGDHPPTSG